MNRAKTRITNVWEKLSPSIFNVIFTGLIALPFGFYSGFELSWKFVWLLVWFIYSLGMDLVFGRCLGMILVGTHFDKKLGVGRQILYEILYTLSFASLLFSVFFPFDLLILNLILLQLPVVLIYKTTLHGLIAGNQVSVRYL